MKIQGSFRGDFVKLDMARNKTRDGQSAHLDVEIGIDADSCAADWGEQFRTLAFATMHEAPPNEDGEVHITHLVDRIKPGRRCTYEHHDVVICGTVKTRCQPEIVGIGTVHGKPAATVVVRIDVEVADVEKIAKHLREHPGALIALEFNPAQLGLGFETKGNGNGKVNGSGEHDEEEPDDEEGASDYGDDDEAAEAMA